MGGLPEQEEIRGYGYFGSFKELEIAIEERNGDKSGGAVVYVGAKVVKEDGKERLEGYPESIYFVRVLPDGRLDVRSDDSYDNE